MFDIHSLRESVDGNHEGKGEKNGEKRKQSEMTVW